MNNTDATNARKQEQQAAKEKRERLRRKEPLISAALQAATAIANLFNNDKAKQKEIFREHQTEGVLKPSRCSLR